MTLSTFPSSDYRMWQHNYDFHQAIESGDYKAVWLCGGIGSGKSVAGIIQDYKMATVWCPGGVGLLGVPDFQSFHQILYPLMQRFWPKHTWWLDRSFNDLQIKIASGGGKVASLIIRSAMNRQTVERWDGPTVDWAHLEEPSRMRMGKAAFLKTLGRMRGTSGALRPVYVTGSPRGFNWLAESWGVQEELPQLAWSQGVETKPKYFVRAAKTEWNKANPDDYFETLVEAYGETFARQELQGAILASEGRIYPNFYTKMNVIDHKRAMGLFGKTKLRTGGGDWGWRRPAALVWGGWDGDGNKIYIGDWYETRHTCEQQGEIAKRISDDHRITKWYVDPSEPENIHKWRYGYRTGIQHTRIPFVYPGINDWMAGVDAVRALLDLRGVGQLNHPGFPKGNRLGRPGLLLTEQMENTINEFRSYRDEDQKSDRPPSERAVGEDHTLDAVRYDVMGFRKKYEPKTGIAKDV